MLKSIIRTFFILTISIYSFYKLLGIKPHNKITQILLLSSSSLTSILVSILFNNNLSLNWLFTLFPFLFLMKYTEKLPLSVTYTTVLFSYSLSFIFFSLSAIISSLFFSPFYFRNYEIPWVVAHFFMGIIHSLLIYFCFRLPRLKKGMSFLYYIPSGNICSSLCIIILMILIMYYQTKTYVETFILSCSATVLSCGFLLIYWWNYHITQTYRKYLKKNEIDSLNLLLEERNQEITYLRNEHDKLARLIHKDNKLIPALSMAVIDSLENGTKLDLSALDCDSSLHMKLKQLYDERVEMLASYEKGRLKLPETGFPSTDAVLSFMRDEALKRNVSYQVMLFDDLATTIPDKVTEKDFTHMLSDLLSNSLNACTGADSAFVRIYLGVIDGISTIKIYNNGEKFSMETLQNLGLARHTTHANTGGSGIGLMDIWMLKEKYKATLLIDETTDKSAETYTCINILFNHKNHFIVQSDRHKELSNYINRPDIMILSKE